MLDTIKHFFSNKKISAHKRVLNPLTSAIASFILPGSAQAINGQYIKGCALLLLWLGTYSLAELSALMLEIIRVVQVVIRIVVSSDAYFISSRMKFGEAVRTWSVLFFRMEAPTEGLNAGHRNFNGKRTLIANAEIIDGTGNPPFRADVLLEGEYIHYIRPHLDRKEKEYTIVDASGCVLAPGFINPCCCVESNLFCDSETTANIRQGFTTEVAGQGGVSLAPVRDDEHLIATNMLTLSHGGQEREKFFNNTGMYLMELEKLPTASRHESMVGYHTIRRIVLGDTESPDEKGIESLCKRVKSSVECGARGISVSFRLDNSISDCELLAVMNTVKEMNAVVSIQLPIGEGTLLPAMERVCSLAQQSGAMVLVTNIHTFGEDCKNGAVFCDIVEKARENGAKLSLSVTGLPFLAISLSEIKTMLAAVGGAERISIQAVGLKNMEWAVGETLSNIAKELECSPEEAVDELLNNNDNDVSALVETDDNDFAIELFSHPYTSLCTDDRPVGTVDCTLPYFLGHYVCGGVLSMEDAVHRNTMQQAAKFGLWDRGLIREGMIADLVLFSPSLLPNELERCKTRGILKVWSTGVLQFDATPTFDVSTLQKRKFMGLPIGR